MTTRRGMGGGYSTKKNQKGQNAQKRVPPKDELDAEKDLARLTTLLEEQKGVAKPDRNGLLQETHYLKIREAILTVVEESKDVFETRAIHVAHRQKSYREKDH